MAHGLTYASSGVDRKARESAKKNIGLLDETLSLSKYGTVVDTQFNRLYPIEAGGNGRYQVKTCDGVGTKVMLAQLAGKHDSIGIDAVAMVANDAIRCGATPIALTNVIDCKKSTPQLLEQLMKGLRQGAMRANCPIVGGETADVAELMNCSYHINCDLVGEVESREKIIDAASVKPGDSIIGLRSSGLHSNGISLARRALFKKWGGKYEGNETPDGFSQSVLLEALSPTKIYVKEFLKLIKNADVHAAVNITGDAYLKFLKIGRGLGFEFNCFEPQKIFGEIQECGKVTDVEMFKTFNMGCGFAVIVARQDADDAVQKLGEGAKIIGRVSDSGKVSVEFNGKKIVL